MATSCPIGSALTPSTAEPLGCGPMIDHLGINCLDLAAAAAFYDRVLGTLGHRRLLDYDVAIVGLGYVGLPTALAYHAAGSRVLALDASSARLTDITAGRADLLETDRVRLGGALRDRSFRLTDSRGVDVDD